MKVAASKRHSLANDYIVVDLRAPERPIPDSVLPELAKSICDRRGPVGADGTAFLLDAEEDRTPLVRIFNPNGSESELCLNGLRCAAKSLLTNIGDRIVVTTGVNTRVELILEEPLAANVPSLSIRVSKPVNRLDSPHYAGPKGGNEDHLRFDEIVLYPMTSGVPHLIGVVDTISLEKLSSLGATLQADPRFPTGMNVSFVRVLDEETFFVKTFERGGAGITRSCSSAIAATATLLQDSRLTCGRLLKAITSGGVSTVTVLESGLLLRANASTVFHTSFGLKADFGLEPVFSADMLFDEIKAFKEWFDNSGITGIERRILA